MSITQFKTVKITDQTLQRFQQNVGDAFKPITGSSIINGAIATFTATSEIAAGSVIALGHGLGRIPVGIIPVVSEFAGVFSASPIANPTPTTVAYLLCNANIAAGQSASFWVF